MDVADTSPAAARTREVDVLRIAARIEAAPDCAAAVELLKQAAASLGAGAAMFTSFVQDDASLGSYRTLLACDPVWGQQYADNGMCLDDPWLRYALHNASPVRSDELVLLNERERWVADCAAHFGFRTALILPAPTPAAQSRVGVLCLGSHDPGFFSGDDYPSLRVLAWSLALELGTWMHRQIRAELMARARITDDDIVLLRHQQQGHTSKVIAAALNTEAKTIDCRFHRLSLRLGAPNRRAALRMAEVYGLL